MSLEELEIFIESIGEKKYRAKQVFSWLYKGIYNFNDMSDLSKELRNKLDQIAYIERLDILKIQESKKDRTRKYLFGLRDGSAIESVFMKYRHGNTVCISSQAGCRMGCDFCASAIGGLTKNLSPSEMVDQVIAIEKDTGEKVNNIVVMGTGEPFDNYDNLCKFIVLIHTQEGMNMSLRNITVSTCGLIPKIKEFGTDFPQVNLAISLHAPNDAIRSKLMPINRKYPMDELLRVCHEHTMVTGRRITFEYALIEGVNDSSENAKELADKLSNILCHVNIIPLNLVSERDYRGGGRRSAQIFCNILTQNGINATIRRELGSDIDAACGQLRLKQKN
ncbi:MAG: 23S rRNA (adenine(2503)-C(2))-methyltransferase RlmN [Clostridiales bacterium]|nr:23S rRNA (adenine(2503)-C(2))-methyltransferase RlmN [Clostridiales bacterium]